MTVKCRWLLLLFSVFFCHAAMAERLAVSGSVANIRSGPAETYNILWKAEKYYPVDVVEKKGVWYKFKDFEGDKGWIHKSLVDNTPSVITVKDKCNFRSGPGTGAEYSVLFEIDKGVPFKVLETKSEWLHVQHADGDKGWVHKSLVW